MAEANLNYQLIKTTHAAREADDQRMENRKKNLIILVLQWLADEGYVESARQLEHETNLDVTKYDVCDNVDLYTIIQEYESYFYVKFNRYPKLTKKNGPTISSSNYNKIITLTNTVVDPRANPNDAIRANVADNIDPTDRLLKPLGGYAGYSSEWRELAEVISRVSENQ
ncbi:unnamed protein product [Rotaria socialis]|uniref:LisH domain-containing protein n=1 Tax=Rotaria socialis TaxID=392032 RepID=A0A820Z7U2_9BILA|nr:unnamed protein product [Rotaria socialis]